MFSLGSFRDIMKLLHLYDQRVPYLRPRVCQTVLNPAVPALSCPGAHPTHLGDISQKCTVKGAPVPQC